MREVRRPHGQRRRIEDGLQVGKLGRPERAGGGTRTHDLPLTRRLLYQLSYSGDPSNRNRLGARV
jgi:hypothetical protein